MWFDKTICNASLFAELQPQRQVSQHPRFKSGEFYSDKCRKDIQHESGLEKDFLTKLERMKKVLFYWEQPVMVPYWRGRIKSFTTPDVGVIFDNLQVVIVEIKPLSGMLDYKVQMKVEGLLKFCAENGCGFLLTDGTNTLDTIRKIKCNRKLEKEILTALEDTVLRKKQCKEIMERCNATQNELLKIIFKHNLRYKPFPFKLRRENKNEIFHKVFYQKKSFEYLKKEQFSTLFKIND